MKILFLLSAIFLSLHAIADVTKPLPEGDRLDQVSDAIRTQLADGNISSGTTSLWAGELDVDSPANEAEFADVVKQGFLEAYLSEEGQAINADAKLRVRVNPFTGADAQKMTDAIMESNDYNTKNKELRNSQARYVWAVLRKLPVDENTLVGHVSTKVKDDTTDEIVNVQYFLLLNANKKAVQLFTVQGSM